MNKRTIIFRADGNSTIGMGHFIRTLALAEMLNNHFYCIYATQTPTDYQIKEIENVCHKRIDLPNNESHFDVFLSHITGDEIVVLDNYYFTTDYQKAIKAKGCKLVCIDDMHDKHFVADIVINHAPLSLTKFSLSAYTKLLLGFDYALLRQQFTQNHIKGKHNSLNHVLICYGGADFNDLTSRTLQAIYECYHINKITIVVGNGYKFIHKLNIIKNELPERQELNILQSVDSLILVETIRIVDFAIVPCSTILYEILSQNIPVITGYYVDNQKEIASSLKNKYDNILVLGNLNNITITDKHIKQLQSQIENKNFIPLITNKASALYLNAFKELEKEKYLRIRKAATTDVDLYYNWANETAVRTNAISTESIILKNHIKWFNKKVTSNNSFLFIIEENKKPIGQVRLDADNTNLVVDYSVDKNKRGGGFGNIILKMVLEVMYSENEIERYESIIAKVKDTNIASFKVFKKLSFQLMKVDCIEGMKYFVFKKDII